jgi:transposase
MDRLLHSPPNPLLEEGEMIGFDVWTEVHARARRGEAKQKIARELDLDRKTVRRILGQARPMPYQRQVRRPSLVVPYLDYIQRRVTEVDDNAYRIFQELQGRGYAGGYEMVKLAVRPLRVERDRQREATMRFETPPGHQAQVDWASVTTCIAGQRRRVHMFVMVLSYSRCQYFEFTEDETLATLITCHEHAFDWFGGLPEEILYDNPKTIVLRRDWQGRHITWNPQFWDFAHYYGFTPRLCPPGRAQTKGKVEAGIKYGKRAFVLGGAFASLADMNDQGHQWIRAVADQRVHGTTFQRPAERFREEPLRGHQGKAPYHLHTVLGRKVAQDCLVTVDTNRYSVPAAYVGRIVDVQWGPDATVQISHGGTLIATHPRAIGQHQLCIDPAHYHVLRSRRALSSPLHGPLSPLTLTSRPELFPEVEVRELACYEAFANQEVGHD